MKLGNTVIFGDSYSTFLGYIPEGYAVYYTPTRESPDVNRVEDTWWHMLTTELEGNIVRNDSWSGSTVGFTGYNGVDCSKTSSFIYRVNKLESDGFFRDNKLDTVLIFGGTNDSWSNAPLGTQQYSDWKKENLFSVLPAICYFMHTLKQNHPNARILFIVNCSIKQAIIQCVQEAALHYGVECVTLRDVDKLQGHPTVLGMQQIYDTLMQYLRNEL